MIVFEFFEKVKSHCLGLAKTLMFPKIRVKKIRKMRKQLICLIDNTLDYNDINKKQNNWKCVSTLSRALQNDVFLRVFQVLALAVRPI